MNRQETCAWTDGPDDPLLQGHYNRRMLRWMPSNMLLGVHILYMSLLLSNFLACVWYYTAAAEGIEKSWLRSVGELPSIYASL